MLTGKLIIAAALAVVSWLGAGPAWAGACDSPEHRQFDFWLGDWRVHATDGKFVGVNVYDAGRRVWRQSWIDNQGLVLLLEGGLRAGSMVLEGGTRDAQGNATRHRITWTPNPDGTVRQHWQTTDAGGAWSTAFDGLYSRR